MLKLIFIRVSAPPLIDAFWLMVWGIAIIDDGEERRKKRRLRRRFRYKL
jgi:hypothetical protein